MHGALIGFTPDSESALLPALLKADAAIKITAVYEEDPALLQRAGRALPEASLYGDLETLLSRGRGLEFAVVRCAAWKRFSAARRALHNRLHTVCETPFCFSTSAFETLREEAASSGRVLSCLQPWERSSSWQALEKALNAGLLGKVRHAEVRLLLTGPAPEGGVTEAAGWKAFAMLLAAVRLPPVALAARLTPRAAAGSGPRDERAAFQVHFGDADGGVYLASGAHAAAASVFVFGERGRAELDGDALRLDIAGVKPETIRFRDGINAAARPEWLAAELADFMKEMKGELPRGSGLRNARYGAKLLKNAYYSSSLNSSAVPL